MATYYQALAHARLYPYIGNEPIYGELLTPTEYHKKGFDKFPNFFREVQISRKQIYFFFGARFPFHESPIRLKEDCSRFTDWS